MKVNGDTHGAIRRAYRQRFGNPIPGDPSTRFPDQTTISRWAKKLLDVEVTGIHNSKKTKIGDGSGRPVDILTEEKLQELRVAIDRSIAHNEPETKGKKTALGWLPLPSFTR